MKKEEERKSTTLGVNITRSELARLKAEFRSTTFKTLSDYIRALLERKPVVKRYRNQSLDDILEALVDVKGGMERLGRDFFDAIEKLRSLPPGAVSSQMVEFLLAEEFALNRRIEEIKLILNKIYRKCDPEATAS